MTEAIKDAKLLEVKQASKEVKESENVAEKYSAMTVRTAEMNVEELSAAFTAVPTHKSVKKVSRSSRLFTRQTCCRINTMMAYYVSETLGVRVSHHLSC